MENGTRPLYKIGTGSFASSISTKKCNTLNKMETTSVVGKVVKPEEH